MIQERIISFLIGYAFGNILFGFFYGKAHHTDLREHGSGNVGSTNTLRTLGVMPGFLSLICDCSKVLIAALIVELIYKGYSEDARMILRLYAAAGAVIGHDFPVILKGKGGKGIASSLGFLIICFPVSLPVALTVFLAAVILTRYVSLGSIMAAATLIPQIIVLAALGVLPYQGNMLYEAVIILCILAVLAIYLHRSNIKRLMNGNENKISFRPNTETK